MSQAFDLELGFEDDAPGFFDAAAARAEAARGRSGGHPVDSVHAALTGAELLARFRVHRPRWFAGLDAESAGIESLLAAEAELSARWGGLPGTDHRSRWDDHGGDVSRPTRLDRQAEWQPPLWLMTPLVRKSGGTLRLKLPASISPTELERALVAHCPPAWKRERVRVRLEIETRAYWGARAPDDLSPWRTCSERGDGVGLAEPLLEIDHGQARWLIAQEDAAAPTIRRSLRPGVGLLVAVPLVIYERLPRPITPVGRLVQRVMDWLGRVAGTPPRDRDPTFIDRLRPDEDYWAAALGTSPPGWFALRQVRASGARLAPASAPAVQAAAAAEPEDAPQIVLLHGGLSSARAGFDAWLAQTPPRRGEPLWPGMPRLESLPVWRFEHDSFLPLDTNIAQLVEALERQVVRRRPHGRLVLLAHSRGGAVARFALPELRDRWPGWDFHALTAGAPHAGTDVFERLGQRWVGLSGAVGLVGLALREAASRSLLAKLKNLERGMAGDIPPGFQDLLPDNLHERASGQPWPAQLVTWGSHWRADVAADWSARGWRHLIEDFGGFEADGDGMIPLESAKHGPLAYDASPVFHTEYFGHPATRQQIDTVLQGVLKG